LFLISFYGLHACSRVARHGRSPIVMACLYWCPVLVRNTRLGEFATEFRTNENTVKMLFFIHFLETIHVRYCNIT
jgi:hypothetical protein